MNCRQFATRVKIKAQNMKTWPELSYTVPNVGIFGMILYLMVTPFISHIPFTLWGGRKKTLQKKLALRASKVSKYGSLCQQKGPVQVHYGLDFCHHLKAS